MSALLAADEVIETPRLRISRLEPAGVDAMSPWLGPALAPDWEIEDLLAHVTAGDAVLIECGRGALGLTVVLADAPVSALRVENPQLAALGLAVVLADAPVEGAFAAPLIAIEPAQRFQGLGGEAARGIERYLRAKRGAERLYAPVPETRGPGVYFWLRLGFRPLLASEAPWPLTGLTAEARAGVWLLRDAP